MPTNPDKSFAGGIRLLLIGLFAYKGLPKIFGSYDVLMEFERYRYPEWFAFVVGVVEVVAALLMLRKPTIGYAATAMAAVMIGATITLINAGDNRQALVPLVVLGAIVYVAWHNQSDEH